MRLQHIDTTVRPEKEEDEDEDEEEKDEEEEEGGEETEKELASSWILKSHHPHRVTSGGTKTALNDTLKTR